MTEPGLWIRGVRPLDGHRHALGGAEPIDVGIEEGRIVAIAPAIDGPRRRGGDELDGGGAWMLPAFADSHLHLHTLAQQRGVLRLSRSHGEAALREALLGRLAGGDGVDWVVAQGWHDPLPEALVPAPRLWLDRLAPERPLWLFAADHHRALLNSVALRACGVPPDGHSGVLLEDAMMAAWREVPPLPADLDGVIADLHRLGITAVTSFDGSRAREVWAGRAGQGELPLRLRHSVPREELLADPGRWSREGMAGGDPDRDGAFAALWVKVFLDGTLGSRTAWLKGDYDDAPGERGDERVCAAERQEIVDAVVGSHLQLAIHAIGDAAIAAAIEMITAVEQARGRPGGAAPHRIEHVQLLDPADLSRLRASGAVASLQPCHLLEDAAVGPERFGSRCRHVIPLRSLREAEVPVTLGSDAPIESADPWVDLDAAVRRVDRAGRFPGGWIPEERVDFATALAGRTSAAATANLLPARWGRIEVGAPADLQLLACDDPREVRSIDGARLVALLHRGRPLRLPDGTEPS